MKEREKHRDRGRKKPLSVCLFGVRRAPLGETKEEIKVMTTGIRDPSLEDFSPFCRIDVLFHIITHHTSTHKWVAHQDKMHFLEVEGIVVKSSDIFLPLYVYVCVCLYTLIFINTFRK